MLALGNGRHVSVWHNRHITLEGPAYRENYLEASMPLCGLSGWEGI